MAYKDFTEMPVWQLNPDNDRGDLTSSKWEGLVGASKKLLSYCLSYMKLPKHILQKKNTG